VPGPIFILKPKTINNCHVLLWAAGMRMKMDAYRDKWLVNVCQIHYAARDMIKFLSEVDTS